jgi:hypothetical protein
MLNDCKWHSEGLPLVLHVCNRIGTTYLFQNSFIYVTYLYTEFGKSFPAIEIVSGRKHLRSCTTTHSKANVALMSEKNNIFVVRFVTGAKFIFFGLPYQRIF